MELFEDLSGGCRHVRSAAEVLEHRGRGSAAEGSFREEQLARLPPPRCAALRSLDLLGANPFGLVHARHPKVPNPLSARTLSLILKHAKELRALCLPPEMTVTLVDVAIGLLPKLKQLRSLNLAGNVHVTDDVLRRLPRGSLPSLRQLNLTGCSPACSADGFTALLEAAPKLQALNAMLGSRGDDDWEAGIVRAVRTAVTSLAANRSVATTLSATAAECCEIEDDRRPVWGRRAESVAGRSLVYSRNVDRMEGGPECRVRHLRQVIWHNLRSYILAKGSQPHISGELYTDYPPTADTLVAFTPGEASHGAPVADFRTGAVARLNCSQNCHGLAGPHGGGLWLVDRDSGTIDLHGHRWAIACGPATEDVGALGMIRPDRAAVALGGVTLGEARAAATKEGDDDTPYFCWAGSEFCGAEWQ